MLERRKVSYDFEGHEYVVDRALFEGDLVFARDTLLKGIGIEYTRSPKAYHRLALKAVSLPLQELIGTIPTFEQMNAVQNTYREMGNLLKSELYSSDAQSEDRKVRSRRVGRLSEDVVYSLLLRQFDYASRGIPVPSTKLEDERHKIDFLVVPMVGIEESEKKIQVKTLLRQRKENGIIHVSMDQLDPTFFDHEAEDSLAHCIVHETFGDASDDQIDKLDRASYRLDLLLS